MPEQATLEDRIIATGALNIGIAETRGGFFTNHMLDLGNEFMDNNPVLADEISGTLAEQLEPFKPRLVIPAPNSANVLGMMVAEKMGIGYTTLKKREDKSFDFYRDCDRRHAVRIGNIALIDNVLTTSGALKELAGLEGIVGNVVAAGVIWNRSGKDPTELLGLQVISLVDRYFPMWKRQPVDLPLT